MQWNIQIELKLESLYETLKKVDGPTFTLYDNTITLLIVNIIILVNNAWKYSIL